VSIVPGRDVPEVPQEWVDAVNKAVNDANHEDLCHCDAWPDACKYYRAGQWDIGVDLDIAVGVLAPLIRERDCRRGDHWKRVAAEIERDRDRLLALLDQARTALAVAAERAVRLGCVGAAVDPAVHTPQRVTAHLGRLGWVRDGGGRIVELWRLPGCPDVCVTVPLLPDGPDYEKVLGFLVSDLARAHGVGATQVLNDIAEADDA